MSNKPQPRPAVPLPPLQRQMDELMRIPKGFETRLRRPEVEALEAQLR